MDTRISAKEFLNLPELNLLAELLDGAVVPAPATSLKRQRLVFKLAKVLEALTTGGEVFLSPVNVLLDHDNVVQPDVIWIAPGSRCKPVENRYWQGAPDLVIEVLMPASAQVDKSTKFKLYDKYGVREYWMVDEATHFIEVWQRADDAFESLGVFGPDDTFQSGLLEGKTIHAKDFFAD